MGRLSSEDLKEREELLVSTNIIPWTVKNCWSKLLTSRAPSNKLELLEGSRRNVSNPAQKRLH